MMNDKFVTQFNYALRRLFVIFSLIFVFTSNSNAQFVEKNLAVTRLKERSAIISANISSMPTTSLEYRFGSLQIAIFKAIYDELIVPSMTVNAAVEKVFAKSLNSNLDRNAESTALMAEYKKKKSIGGFDLFQPIKDEVNKLLK